MNTTIIITIAVLITPIFLYALGYFFGKGQMRAKSNFLKHELKNFWKGEA